METKLLLRLIRDDLKLLDGIVASLIGDTQPDKEEVEVALIRARGILTEFEMLSKNLSAAQKTVEKPAEVTDRKITEPVIPVIQAAMTEEPDLIDLEEEPVAVPVEEKSAIIKEVVTPIAETKPGEMVKLQTPAQTKAEEPVKPESVKSEPIMKAEAPVSGKEKVVHHSEIGEDHHLKTLGESIVETHQLVHDRWVSDKEEHLFEGKPLKSIREGIGLNDRFLFIRELFSGDSEHYNRTLDQLDRFVSIKEAVDYLKVNFKWNKNEAGEKFLHLVKRRYTN